MNTKHLIPRLLSRRNQISSLEKEEILLRVLARAAPPRRRSIAKPWLAISLGLGAAAAIGLVILATYFRGSAPPPEFASRGTGDVKPSFRVRCSGELGEDACRAGNKLIFEFEAGESSFFAAFARRGDGAVIWYFPKTSSSKSENLSQNLVNGVLETGILLDSKYSRGSYEIYGVFSATAMSRDEVKMLVEGGLRSGKQSPILVKQQVFIP